MPPIMEIVEVFCFRGVEQIVASCHRSFEIVEVTAGAVPVVVDVAVIMQRQVVSRTVFVLRFSSSPEFADIPVRS